MWLDPLKTEKKRLGPCPIVFVEFRSKDFFCVSGSGTQEQYVKVRNLVVEVLKIEERR